MVRKIALDPGFYAIKVAEARDPDQPRPDVFWVPSVVGVGSTDMGLLDVGVIQRRIVKPHQVRFDDMEYLVGPAVERFARPIERMDFLRLGDSPGIRACVFAALYAIAAGGDEKLAILVGLPVEVLQSDAQAGAVVGDIRHWLEGEHRFWVDDREILFTVQEVQVAAQPQGAMFEWGLNMRGQWAHPTATVRDKIAVLDVGFNTVDLYAIEDGRVNRRFTGGNTAGMRRAAQLMVNALSRQGLAPSLHQADEWLRQYTSNPRRRKPFETNVGDEMIDLKPLMQRALQSTTEEIVGFVERLWGNGRQFRHVLLAGGGALPMSESFLHQFPHATLLPDAATANARGLARFARRDKTFKKVE
jgi:hypothetical protein